MHASHVATMSDIEKQAGHDSSRNSTNTEPWHSLPRVAYVTQGRAVAGRRKERSFLTPWRAIAVQLRSPILIPERFQPRWIRRAARTRQAAVIRRKRLYIVPGTCQLAIYRNFQDTHPTKKRAEEYSYNPLKAQTTTLSATSIHKRFRQLSTQQSPRSYSRSKITS